MKISKELVKALAGCRWVDRITSSQIIFTYKFKVETIEEYLRGGAPEKIFSEAGIPVELLPKQYPRHCIKRWTKQYKEHGLDALKEDKRGTARGWAQGRPKKLDDDLTYEELKAIVQIQTEVIETLKKRRALAQKK